jgi:hypothetical protein
MLEYAVSKAALQHLHSSLPLDIDPLKENCNLSSGPEVIFLANIIEMIQI